ncbi:hypothetical protein ACH5RR_037973 [Cinchona calisaya]|uniref:Uncharacterized protein n=1 Tax=Cinchona calisaya TaxID=153742 RepID=A0ABD2YBQ6_9GENT
MTQNGVEGCSSGTNSCDMVWRLPELSSGGSFDGGRESKLKKWPCMLAEGENLDGTGGGGGVGGEGEEVVVVVKKGPWTAEEDERLKKCVEEYGIGNWITIEKYSGLGRTSKSCRLRWTNHLRPNLKKGSFTKEEERIVVKLHQKYGNKWSYISSKLPGRTDNEIKNFWHGRVRRYRRKFLPIYPENIDDGGLRRDGLDIDGKKNFNGDDHNSAAMDGTNSIPPFPYVKLPELESPLSHCVPSQQQSNPMINQNPASVFTPLAQTQLVSPPQQPLSSPHSFSSSHYPSPACYPTQIPQSPLSTLSQTQYHSIQRSQLTETPDTTLVNPPLSLQQDSSSIQQSDSNTHFAFTPLKPPPVLSSLVGQIKGSQGSSSLLSSPPTLTHFLAPAQRNSISVTGSSVPSPKINVSSSVPTSQFTSTTTGSRICSPKLHLSVQLPTTSSVQQQTSSLPSALSSCNLNSPKLNDLTTVSPHSSLRLNLTSSIPPDSYLQHNPCAAPSLLFSQLWNSSKSEPPSVQTPTSALRPTPKMKTDQLETDVPMQERCVAPVDPPMEQAQAKTDTLYNSSLEEQCVDRFLVNNDLHGKMMVTENIRDNMFFQSSREGGFFSEKPRTMNLLDQSLKQEYTKKEKPKTQQLVKKVSCRKVSHNKILRSENLMGKISRRQGLLSEISKTGVLLVESEKKQILLRELLNENPSQEVLASQCSKTVDPQLARISKTTKLFGEMVSTEDPPSQISKRKGSVGQKSGEGVSIFENLTSLMSQNLEENMLDISSKMPISLTLQEQTSDPDAIVFPYSPKDVTTRLRSDGLLVKFSSAQIVAGEVCDEIFRGDAPLASEAQEHELQTLGTVFCNGPELVLSKTGNDKEGNLIYGESHEGDNLNKSLREKCTDSPKGESMGDQSQSGQFIGGGFITECLLVSQDQQEIILGSVCDLDRYMTINILKSLNPDGKLNSPQPCEDDILGEALSIEGSSSRSLKNVSLDQSSREIFLGESSTERIMALHEVTLNEFVSPTSKSTSTQLLTSHGHCTEAGFSQCYEGSQLKPDIEEDLALPEGLSDLLGFSPTALPDWHDIGCEDSNVMDMAFGLEMYHLHPVMR